MARDRELPDNPWIRIVFGAAILALGVIIWLDRLHRIDGNDYLRWWPVVLIAVGIAHLPSRQWGGAAIWAGLGAIFLLPLINAPYIPLRNIFGVWPLLISYGGIALIRQGLRPPASGSVVNVVAVMAGNVRTVSTQFAGANVVAVMGGCEINLSSAKIVDEATIDAVAFWGGVEIIVPRDVKVIMHVVGLLGGVDVKTAPAPEGAPRLIVRGSAVMGGMEIRNPKEDAL